MKQCEFEILGQRPLAKDVWEMRLAGDVSAVTKPGGFVQIALPGFTLRRPISVCNVELAADGAGVLTLIYKVVGEGTKVMATLPAGTRLDLLTGLGNGYDLAAAGARPLLVGGGVGTPPLYWAARQLREAGKEVTVILAFNGAADVFYRDEFEALGCRVYICTMDGSVGTKGFATDVMAKLDAQAARLRSVMAARTEGDQEREIAADINSILPDEDEDLAAYTYVYACGPAPMLRAVCAAATSGGEVSMEERMGCGFGACMGCTLVTAAGPKRVCKDGPVFKKEDLLW